MYTLHYGGKEGPVCHLVESPDLVAVSTETEAPLSEQDLSGASRGLVGQMTLLADFPEAGIAVYQVQETDSSNAKKLRNRIRKQLKQEKAVRFAGRVLVDPNTGSICVYTEKIFVKFKDDVHESTCESILQAFMLHILEKISFANNAYFTSVEPGSGLKVFSIAENLLQREEVELCHPEVIMQAERKL